jgi:hypothetical protein
VLDLHRHLRQGQAPALRQVEQLDVEGEAVDGGGFEQRTGDVGPERLEPALGVPVLPEEQGVGRQVDEPPSGLAQAAGADDGLRTGVATAAHDHVVTRFDGLEELGDL